MNRQRFLTLIGLIVALLPLLVDTNHVAHAITPDYRIPCKISANGNWKVVRDRRGFGTDQQLIDHINTQGRYAHPDGLIAVDFNNNPNNLGPRTYGICDDLTIVAARRGWVVKNEWESTGGGYTVILDHRDGQFSAYSHMPARSPLVALGQEVQEGSPIGTMGCSGDCWGTHVHFAVRNQYGPQLSDWRFRNTLPVSNQPPRIPNQVAPATNSALGSRTITLQWQDAGDPDNSPRTYRDYYAEIWNADTSWRQSFGWTADTSWTITVPSDGHYSWRVRSGDGALGSAWSSAWAFNVNTLRANTFRDAGAWSYYSGTDDDRFFVADFDGDGKDDLIFATTRVNGPTGSLTWYWMKSNGSRYVDKGNIMAAYAVVGDQFYVADFDGDGKDDILTATSRVNGSTGSLTWYWLRSTGSGFEDRGVIAPAYGMLGDQFYVADVDGDGKDDILTATGRVNGADKGLTWYWLRSTGVSVEDRGVIVPAYGMVGDQFYVADFDGDGKDDILTATSRVNGSTGSLTWYWLRSTGTQFAERGVVAPAYGMLGDQFYAADFNGDGKDDLVMGTSRVNGSTGSLTWYWLRSTGSQIEDGGIIHQAYGVAGDRFYASDFNGDGKGDLVSSMTRYTQARKGLTWFWMRSNGLRIEDGGRVKTAYGIEGDALYPADLDGDGQGDLIVVTSRINGPTGGLAWFWMQGTPSGFVDMGELNNGYGRPGDQIRIADMDGDRKDDVMLTTTRVNGPANGLTWYWLRSTGASFEDRGQMLAAYGMVGDQFYVADVDGDGKDDILTATGRVNGADKGLTWYWLRSTGASVEDRGIVVPAYGMVGDQFYVADFDGDGKDDILIATSRVNGSTGSLTWYWLRSTGGGLEDRGVIAQSWGGDVDRYFIGDVNGDGKDDVLCATARTNGDATLRWYVAGADATNMLADIPNTIWASRYGIASDQVFVQNYRQADRVIPTTADVVIAREIDNALQSWMMFSDFQ